MSRYLIIDLNSVKEEHKDIVEGLLFHQDGVSMYAKVLSPEESLQKFKEIWDAGVTANDIYGDWEQYSKQL